MSKILILKNDRVGDLFHSLKGIYSVIEANKHQPKLFLGAMVNPWHHIDFFNWRFSITCAHKFCAIWSKSFFEKIDESLRDNTICHTAVDTLDANRTRLECFDGTHFIISCCERGGISSSSQYSVQFFKKSKNDFMDL